MLRGKLLSLLTGTAVVIGLLAAPGVPAQAASGSDFDAADIMSDSLFYDGSAMTSSQIQSFLDSKIGNCSSSDCINILRTSVSSRAARISDTTGNLVCKAFTGGTNLLVSEIIYRSQVACGISAKVILVTLQKEQGLVTSKNPSNWNLNFAMGQACPDTAPCDPAFQGIGVQILAGTTQLKTYKAANFARQPGTHSIKYNPSSSCGTKTITIRNYATAALYNYTPYTPNAAALSNLYGSGNSCSSYGNRNFWRDYTDWFGSTHSNLVTTVDSVAHLLSFDTSGELWAYPTNRKSGWLPRVSLGTSWSGIARLVAPGDLDGDGHRDLITLSTTNAAKLYRGDGSLGYDSGTAIAVNWADAKLVSAAGDFSGDGIPDVFTTSAAGHLLLWRGTATGSFHSPVRVGNGWSVMNAIVGGTDLTGDGNVDLLARRTDGALLVYYGDGHGGWSGSKQIGSRWSGMKTVHAIGDVTGDGRVDVLAITRGGALWLYPGTNGAISTGRQVGKGWQSMTLVADSGPPATGVRVMPAGAGDADGDGNRDVVGIDRNGVVLVYRGNGAGAIAGAIKTTVTIPSGSSMQQMGDFNGDGISDLGMIDTAGTFRLLPGDGKGGYGAAVQIGNGWNIYDYVIGGLDFDGDRRYDVLARDSSGHLYFYAGNGAGGWSTGNGVQIGKGWAAMTSISAVGDFNGDRTADVIARHATGTLYLYAGDGTGGWRSSAQLGQGWNGMTALSGTGNFDDAGGPDIVARHSSGKLYLYRGNGKGGFSGAGQIGHGWNNIIWIG